MPEARAIPKARKGSVPKRRPTLQKEDRLLRSRPLSLRHLLGIGERYFIRDSFELLSRLFRVTLPQLRRRMFASEYLVHLIDPMSVRFTEPMPSWMNADPGSESRKLTTYGA